MFVAGNATLNSTSIGGPVALGGNLTVGTSSFNVAAQTGGAFTVSGDAHPTGLLVGGNVNWAGSGSNGAVNVLSSDYVKVGDMTGSAVLTSGNTHVVRSGQGFDSHPQIAEVVSQPTASITQSGLIGFTNAFSTFSSQSTNLANCTGTVTLTNANGTALPGTLPPGTNAYVSLTPGVQNVLNITAANLANISILQFRSSPNASTPLVINVGTSGVGNNFTWSPPNFNGLQSADAGYILWNFATATTLTLSGSSTIPGTIYAPGSTVAETDQNGINGGVIAATYTQGVSSNGGQVVPSPFATTVTSCGIAQLTISKSADVSTTTPASTVHYTVTVTNSGAVAYTGATFTDPLTGVLDDASYNSDAAATAGTVSFSSPNLTWSGNLAVGALATVTYSVTVRSPDPGNGILSNTVTSTTTGSNCASGSIDSRCTAMVTVTSLTIVKTASTSATTPGAAVGYTVTVTNSGQTAFTGAAFTDPLGGVLDDAAYNGDVSATAGSASFSSPNVTWTGNLAPGASATVTYSVTVKNPDTGNGILANTVTSATTGSNCAGGSADARCTATVPVSSLTIVKSADVSTATPGAVVHYMVTVTNSGKTAYTGAAFTDPLAGVIDDAVYNGDASATAGGVSYVSPALSWTGNLAVGASATVTYSVTVSSPDLGDKTLVNTVTSAAAGSNCPSGGTDARCTVSVTVLIPGLTIVKSADVSATSPGAVVHYTVTVTDTGQTAYAGAAFTDPLGGVLDDAAYNGDAAASSGSVSYAAPDLSWSGSLAVGAAATVTYSVTVNNPDLGDKTLVNTVTSATAGSNCPVSGGADPRCTAAVADLAPGLGIVKTADVATATPGAVVHYTVTVTNTGQTAYTGAGFTDPLGGVLDDASYNANAAATAGTVSFASPDLSWSGNLAVGAAATITYSVTVKSPDTGDGTLTNTITSATPGNNCPAAGGTDPACTATVKVARLAIVNTANVATTTPGGVVRFTATFTNTGQVPYNQITVATDASGVFDDATANGDQTASSGTLSITGAVVSWTGDIGVGGTVTITGTVTVNNPDTGSQVLSSTITTAAAGSNCPAGGGDPACSVSVTVLTPALTIVKTADATSAVPGQKVTYTVTVTDTGPTPYTGAAVTDSFAQMADDAVYDGDASATGGLLSYTSPVLTWTGDLAVGGAVTITYSVTVNSPDTGDKLVINTVSSTAAGATCPPATTAPACRVTMPVLTPGLTIATAASTATTVPGGTVTYTVTVTNSGQTPYTGAAFTAGLSGVLDDAGYNADAAATGSGTGSTVSFASPVLTWTGNLAAGAAETITYSVTVSSPDTGNHVLASTVTSATAGSNCAAGSADPRCATSVAVAQLTITAGAGVSTTAPGGVVRYTGTFTNNGQVPYTGITILSNTAGISDDATSNGDAAATSGTTSVTSTGASWTGDIPVGGAVTVTGSVTVRNPDPGDQVLHGTTTTTAPGSNCPSGGTDPRCATTVTVLTPALTIIKTADATAVLPGQKVTYTLTVHDTGPTAYTGATVTDSFAQMADDAVYDNDAATTAGDVSYTSPTLTWTGDLTAGGSAVITYSVTVDNPDTGDKQVINTVSSPDAGATCPPGATAPACPAHRRGAHPGADHRQDGRRGDGDTGHHGPLHDHRHQQRPDSLHRGDLHRRSDRRAGRRHLQQRCGTGGPGLFFQPGADLDR